MKKTLTPIVVKRLKDMGHGATSDKTMGSTQSIHIIDGGELRIL